jgi:hypothetical protein
MEINRNADDAIADFTKSIEIKPNDADAYIRRGSAKFGKGDWQSAFFCRAKRSAVSFVSKNLRWRFPPMPWGSLTRHRIMPWFTIFLIFIRCLSLPWKATEEDRKRPKWVQVESGLKSQQTLVFMRQDLLFTHQTKWCPRQDLNLNLARLPIPPRGQPLFTTGITLHPGIWLYECKFRNFIEPTQTGEATFRWRKRRLFPKVPYLLQCVGNDNYYDRIKVGGKMICESLSNDVKPQPIKASQIHKKTPAGQLWIKSAAFQRSHWVIQAGTGQQLRDVIEPQSRRCRLCDFCMHLKGGIHSPHIHISKKAFA